MAAGLVDDAANVFLGMMVSFNHLSISLGLFQRIDVLPLDVLDQLDMICQRLSGEPI